MATIDVKDAANTTQTLERPLPPGQATMTASRPVVIASNQSAVPVSGTVTINAIPAGTANIGDVDIASIAAGTNTIGKIDQGLAHASARWLVDASISNVPAVTLSANNNNVRLNDSGGGGLTSAIRGSERALSIQVVDAAGNQITSFGGGAGATTYTEDAALPADPVGGAIVARRRDTLSTSEVSADGDAITLNATSKGQLHTLTQIDPAQLGAVGPQTKAASTSVTRATNEYTKGTTFAQVVGSGSETTIVFAGSGTKRNVYGIILSNTHATLSTQVTIRDATSASGSIFVLTVPPSDMRGFTLDCGSAVVQTAASNNWTATNSAAVTVNITTLWVEE